jgi:hypothetical protein
MQEFAGFHSYNLLALFGQLVLQWDAGMQRGPHSGDHNVPRTAYDPGRFEQCA